MPKRYLKEFYWKDYATIFVGLALYAVGLIGFIKTRRYRYRRVNRDSPACGIRYKCEDSFAVYLFSCKLWIVVCGS
jgi:hypothetical protein